MAHNNRYSVRIKQHFQCLVRSLELTEPLLTELSFIDCMKEGIRGVASASTEDVKNARLLGLLWSNSTDVVDEFIDILQRYGQHHVANLLLNNVANADVLPMSEQHLQLLREKEGELCEYLDPCVSLLADLQSRGVLTRHDADRISCKSTQREMSYELLRILERKPDRAFDDFITSLGASQQSHVVYILTNEGEPPIAKSDVDWLNRIRCKVVDNLEPIDSGLVDELKSQGAITEAEYQKVKEEKSRFDKSVYLVDILTRKSDRAFRCFVKTLTNTGQDHLAMLFRITGITGTVTLNGSFSSEERSMLEDTVLTEMQSQELLTELQNTGIYGSAEKGSIKIQFRCMSADSVTKLRQLCDSGEINELLYENHGRKFSERGLQSMTVDIPASEFKDAQSCTIMTAEHKRLLRSAAEKFARRLNVTEQLLSRLPLCRRRQEAIISQSSTEERSRLLFEIVSRQPDSAFQQLVDALRNTGWPNIARFLQSDSSQTRTPSPPTRSTITSPNRDNDTKLARLLLLLRSDSTDVASTKFLDDDESSTDNLHLNGLFRSYMNLNLSEFTEKNLLMGKDNLKGKKKKTEEILNYELRASNITKLYADEYQYYQKVMQQSVVYTLLMHKVITEKEFSVDEKKDLLTLSKTNLQQIRLKRPDTDLSTTC